MKAVKQRIENYLKVKKYSSIIRNINYQIQTFHEVSLIIWRETAEKFLSKLRPVDLLPNSIIICWYLFTGDLSLGPNMQRNISFVYCLHIKTQSSHFFFFSEIILKGSLE